MCGVGHGWEHIRSLRHLKPKWHIETKISPSLTKHLKNRCCFNEHCLKSETHKTKVSHSMLSATSTHRVTYKEQRQHENHTNKNSSWTSRLKSCLLDSTQRLFETSFGRPYITSTGAITRANKTEGRVALAPLHHCVTTQRTALQIMHHLLK